MKDKKPTVEDGNGKQIMIPAIMDGNQQTVEIISEFKKDISRSNRGQELTKYLVQEGMQNEEKVPFFTEYINDDDVLRMNTIEMFVNVAPLIIRKTSINNMTRINRLMQDVYVGHVKTHRRNMVAKGRKREEAYVKILSSDSSDSGVVPTGVRKFFGIGGKK